MQLGFVIDHSKCIGCHACTVACKSENAVPVGDFRTWVKYTEQGTFPEVKRSFAVLRCNQCTEAPCVQICPVSALEKRPDGIVDVDPARCIGCKACMQGCPYDALYLNAESGTAEKCHFCAHRVEVGLAPACAVVCPTEAIIPGDFHDPSSAVSKLKSAGDLAGRKPEAGTGPNVFYRDAAPAGIDPQKTTPAGGYLWANRSADVNTGAELFDAALREAEDRARTTYSVDHPARWGNKITAYLFFKSISAGLFLILAMCILIGVTPDHGPALASGVLLFLTVTTAFLIADLKKPKRFLFILTKPNWNSWLARGSYILVAFGMVAGLVCLLLFMNVTSAAVLFPLVGAGSILAALSAGYTGWLFAQAKGRVLWMRRGLWLHLIVQALVAGAAGYLILGGVVGWEAGPFQMVRWTLMGALLIHAGFVLTEERCSPPLREKEFLRTIRLITRGPFSRTHYGLGLGVGVAVPVGLLLIPGVEFLWLVAGLGALWGLWVEENIMVEAGQTLPIS